MNDPDADLMLTFCRGQEDAFVELYRRYRDRIVAFCRRIVGTDAQAEEAAQDVFIKLYRAREGYAARSRFSTFIYRIAANHCLNLQGRVEHKVVQRGVEIDARSAPGEANRAPAPHAALEQGELRDQLARALATLPDRQRAALVLVHYEGLSYEEAAEAIDVTESALKSLIHRARAAMMHELAPFMQGGTGGTGGSGRASKGARHAM
jgi:RNA polymerase sigma-70 factor (ECF subfamily)